MTSRRDRKYVRQCIGDLVGLHARRRRAAVMPEDGELPTGVSARMALLWAAPADPSLVTAALIGGAQPGRRHAGSCSTRP
jgi:hypothetical protein